MASPIAWEDVPYDLWCHTVAPFLTPAEQAALRGAAPPLREALAPLFSAPHPAQTAAVRHKQSVGVLAKVAECALRSAAYHPALRGAIENAVPGLSTPAVSALGHAGSELALSDNGAVGVPGVEALTARRLCRGANVLNVAARFHELVRAAREAREGSACGTSAGQQPALAARRAPGTGPSHPPAAPCPTIEDGFILIAKFHNPLLAGSSVRGVLALLAALVRRRLSILLADVLGVMGDEQEEDEEDGERRAEGCNGQSSGAHWHDAPPYGSSALPSARRLTRGAFDLARAKPVWMLEGRATAAAAKHSGGSASDSSTPAPLWQGSQTTRPPVAWPGRHTRASLETLLEQELAALETSSTSEARAAATGDAAASAAAFPGPTAAAFLDDAAEARRLPIDPVAEVPLPAGLTMAALAASDIGPGRLIQVVTDVLISEFGLRGDKSTYYDAANSYLDQVLLRRKGLPITTCTVYAAVCRLAGITGAAGEVSMVGSPGHVLLRYDPPSAAALAAAAGAGEAPLGGGLFRDANGGLAPWDWDSVPPQLSAAPHPPSSTDADATFFFIDAFDLGRLMSAAELRQRFLLLGDEATGPGGGGGLVVPDTDAPLPDWAGPAPLETMWERAVRNVVHTLSGSGGDVVWIVLLYALHPATIDMESVPAWEAALLPELYLGLSFADVAAAAVKALAALEGGLGGLAEGLEALPSASTSSSSGGSEDEDGPPVLVFVGKLLARLLTRAAQEQADAAAGASVGTRRGGGRAPLASVLAHRPLFTSTIAGFTQSMARSWRTLLRHVGAMGSWDIPVAILRSWFRAVSALDRVPEEHTLRELMQARLATLQSLAGAGLIGANVTAAKAVAAAGPYAFAYGDGLAAEGVDAAAAQAAGCAALATLKSLLAGEAASNTVSGSSSGSTTAAGARSSGAWEHRFLPDGANACFFPLARWRGDVTATQEALFEVDVAASKAMADFICKATSIAVPAAPSGGEAAAGGAPSAGPGPASPPMFGAPGSSSTSLASTMPAPLVLPPAAAPAPATAPAPAPAPSSSGKRRGGAKYPGMEELMETNSKGVVVVPPSPELGAQRPTLGAGMAPSSPPTSPRGPVPSPAPTAAPAAPPCPEVTYPVTPELARALALGPSAPCHRRHLAALALFAVAEDALETVQRFGLPALPGLPRLPGSFTQRPACAADASLTALLAASQALGGAIDVAAFLAPALPPSVSAYPRSPAAATGGDDDLTLRLHTRLGLASPQRLGPFVDFLAPHCATLVEAAEALLRGGAPLTRGITPAAAAAASDVLLRRFLQLSPLGLHPEASLEWLDGLVPVEPPPLPSGLLPSPSPPVALKIGLGPGRGAGRVTPEWPPGVDVAGILAVAGVATGASTAASPFLRPLQPLVEPQEPFSLAGLTLSLPTGAATAPAAGGALSPAPPGLPVTPPPFLRAKSSTSGVATAGSAGLASSGGNSSAGSGSSSAAPPALGARFAPGDFVHVGPLPAGLLEKSKDKSASSSASPGTGSSTSASGGGGGRASVGFTTSGFGFPRICTGDTGLPAYMRPPPPPQQAPAPPPTIGVVLGVTAAGPSGRAGAGGGGGGGGAAAAASGGSGAPNPAASFGAGGPLGPGLSARIFGAGSSSSSSSASAPPAPPSQLVYRVLMPDGAVEVHEAAHLERVHLRLDHVPPQLLAALGLRPAERDPDAAARTGDPSCAVPLFPIPEPLVSRSTTQQQPTLAAMLGGLSEESPAATSSAVGDGGKAAATSPPPAAPSRGSGGSTSAAHIPSNYSYNKPAPAATKGSGKGGSHHHHHHHHASQKKKAEPSLPLPTLAPPPSLRLLARAASAARKEDTAEAELQACRSGGKDANGLGGRRVVAALDFARPRGMPAAVALRHTEARQARPHLLLASLALDAAVLLDNNGEVATSSLAAAAAEREAAAGGFVGGAAAARLGAGGSGGVLRAHFLQAEARPESNDIANDAAGSSAGVSSSPGGDGSSSPYPASSVCVPRLLPSLRVLADFQRELARAAAAATGTAGASSSTQ